jgi:hypothetical protein
LSELTGYLVKQTSENAKCKCGFPASAMDKIKTVLDESGVSYVVYEKAEITMQKDCGDNNRFRAIVNSFDQSKIEKKFEEGTTETSVTETDKEKKAPESQHLHPTGWERRRSRQSNVQDMTRQTLTGNL